MKEIIESLKLAIASNDQEAINNEITAKLNGDNIEEALIHTLKNDEQELLAFLLNNKFISNTHLEDIYFTSVMRADKELLEKILPKMQNKAVLNPDGETALHVAVSNMQTAIDGYKYTNDNTLRDLISKYIEIIETLIKSGISLNTENKKGENILSFCAKLGLIDVIKYLVEELRIDINAKDKRDRTALHYALLSGNLELVKYLIEELKLDVNIKDYYKKTILHYAASSGNLKLVKYLVEEHRIDVNATDKNDETALYYAVLSGNLELVKYLVEEKGINVKSNIYQAKTILDIAAENGHLDIIKYFVETKDLYEQITNNYLNRTALHNIALGWNDTTLEKHIEVVEYLIKYVDINAVDKNDDTALNLAGQMKNFGVIKCLIKNGADITIENKYQKIALDYLEENERLEIFKYLIKNRTDINAAYDIFGNTLLHIAVQRRYLNVIGYLIKNEADVSIENKYGKTTLDYATENGLLEEVEHFIKNKADSNTESPDIHPQAISQNTQTKNKTNYELTQQMKEFSYVMIGLSMILFLVPYVPRSIAIFCLSFGTLNLGLIYLRNNQIDPDQLPPAPAPAEEIEAPVRNLRKDKEKEL